MKISIRSLGLATTLGAVVVLTGCVAAGPGYYGDGYGQPYYSDPVVVSPSPVYIEGGGYYGGSRPYYRQPYYDGRRGYPPPVARPGYGPRPGYGAGPGVRPVPVPVQPAQRINPGYPRPIVVPPAGRGAPGGTIQPSWNNQERP